MTQLGFQGWDSVGEALKRRARDDASSDYLNEGQRDSLHAIATRLTGHGVLVADEVGMGKTRLAVEVARAVLDLGGRVACVIPPGLGYQWKDELSRRGIEAGDPVRGLHSYLQAWDTDLAKPWHDQALVLVSHNFANWRFQDSSHSWRWALLPKMIALLRQRHYGRLPRGYNHRHELHDKKKNIEAAAESIVKYTMRSTREPCYSKALKLADTEWNGGSLFSGAAYAKDGEYRQPLAQAMGLGLGAFDLVIVDEAHKSRAVDSGLNSLLNDVLVTSRIPRRVALTATPIELDSEQWLETLGRIDIPLVDLEPIRSAVQRYKESLDALRNAWRNSTQSREQFHAAAKAFEAALRPYVVRRDKRQEESVVAFAKATGFHYDKYRVERAVEIDIASDTIPAEWKKAVLAAEALSFCSGQVGEANTKRIRLTVGNGHGIASIIDESLRDESKDKEQVEAEAERQDEMPTARQAPAGKEQQRVTWWTNIIKSAFSEQENVLFDHPAIMAAVDTIEAVTRGGEKVLVFGRFTKPLRALTLLLNARELLRRVEAGHYWPQAKIHAVRAGDGLDEVSALRAAHRQLGAKVPIKTLNKVLSENYSKHESRRRHFRENLLGIIGEGLEGANLPGSSIRLFHALAERQGKSAKALPEIALLSRAILEASDSGLDVDLTPAQVAQLFHDLVTSAGDSDDFSGNSDPGWEKSMWSTLHERLREEYNRPEGGYARLMNGGVEMPTRRLLQAAFNRQGSFPRVLVAQSVVGREGLNLHRACKTVVLLHPEWNPGVVEQQVGRVDRVGSLWASKVSEAIGRGTAPEDIPRIEFMPIVFRGTYDEHNWAVLRERWDDLRAHLHGIALPPRLAADDPEACSIIDDLNSKAPSFKPPARPR